MKIWYMRDNHTFRCLTKRGNPIMARGRLQDEFNAGWKHGVIFLGEDPKSNLSVTGEIPDNIDEWLLSVCKQKVGNQC